MVFAEPPIGYPSLAGFLFLRDPSALVLLAPSQVLIAVVAFSYLVATVLALLPVPATPVSWSNGSLFFAFPAQLPSTLAFGLLSLRESGFRRLGSVWLGGGGTGRFLMPSTPSVTSMLLRPCHLMFFTEEASYGGVHASQINLGCTSALVLHVLPRDDVPVWVSLAVFLAVVASQLSFCTSPRVLLVLHALTSVLVGAAGEIGLFPEA